MIVEHFQKSINVLQVLQILIFCTFGRKQKIWISNSIVYMTLIEEITKPSFLVFSDLFWIQLRRFKCCETYRLLQIWQLRKTKGYYCITRFSLRSKSFAKGYKPRTVKETQLLLVLLYQLDLVLRKIRLWPPSNFSYNWASKTPLCGSSCSWRQSRLDQLYSFGAFSVRSLTQSPVVKMQSNSPWANKNTQK